MPKVKKNLGLYDLIDLKKWNEALALLSQPPAPPNQNPHQNQETHAPPICEPFLRYYGTNVKIQQNRSLLKHAIRRGRNNRGTHTHSPLYAILNQTGLILGPSSTALCLRLIELGGKVMVTHRPCRRIKPSCLHLLVQRRGFSMELFHAMVNVGGTELVRMKYVIGEDDGGRTIL